MHITQKYGETMAALFIARDAAPTPEHYQPFLYIAATRRNGEPLRMSSFARRYMGSSAMQSVRTGRTRDDRDALHPR